MSPKEKQAAAQQTFVFRKLLTRIPPVKAGNRARQCEDPSIRYNECREKQAAAQQTFVFRKLLTRIPPVKAGSKARQCEDLSIR